MLATATRPSGFAVPLGLLFLYLEQTGALRPATREGHWTTALRLPTKVDRSQLRPKVVLPLAGLAWLFGYMAWQWASWGLLGVRVHGVRPLPPGGVPRPGADRRVALSALQDGPGAVVRHLRGAHGR